MVSFPKVTPLRNPIPELSPEQRDMAQYLAASRHATRGASIDETRVPPRGETRGLALQLNPEIANTVETVFTLTPKDESSPKLFVETKIRGHQGGQLMNVTKWEVFPLPGQVS